MFFHVIQCCMCKTFFYLTLPVRLVVLSSIGGRGPAETYTDMLGCSMRRSSMGLASAVAPSAVKQGGGVTNQLSSMLQSLQEHEPRSLNNTFTSTDSRWEKEAGSGGEQMEGEEGCAASLLPALVLRFLQKWGEGPHIRDAWHSLRGQGRATDAASGPSLP